MPWNTPCFESGLELLVQASVSLIVLGFLAALSSRPWILRCMVAAVLSGLTTNVPPVMEHGYMTMKTHPESRITPAINATIHQQNAFESPLYNKNSGRNSNGSVQLDSRNGPTPILTKGEVDGILQAVKERTLHAQCFTKEELTNFIRVCIEDSQYERAVPNSFPSNTFVKNFVRKHSHAFSSRLAQGMDSARSKRSTVDVVQSHFTNLETVMQANGFEPDCIWNLDETGTCAQGSRNKQRVYATKYLPANVQRSDSRKNVSVLVAINANGNHLPPFFLLPGKDICSRMTHGASEGSTFAATESSFLSTGLFIQYFEWFVCQIPPKRPVLLLMDGYKAHWSAKTIAFTMNQGILLYALPSHTSHFLQSLDVSVFCHFKRHLDNELTRFRQENKRFAVTSDMVGVASKALRSSLSRTYIVGGFEKTGIWPLSCNMMMTKIIGDKPGDSQATKHLNASIQIEERTMAFLQQNGINIDTARVLCINEQMIRGFIDRKTIPRQSEEWVHGGCLMTTSEIARKVAEKEERQLEKLKRSKEKKDEAAVRKATSLAKKIITNDRKREVGERRLMASEDKAKRARRKRKLPDTIEIVEL
ncbi:hypothetical protein AeMF1_000595 [Aphanomyces euteiches]|nr:hypothetical protein AeMF1_000595 [Aphanomyces euteiches]KAH9196154.1 hypothetical protein AeNC1_001857 [Aphanomyces euteiches]